MHKENSTINNFNIRLEAEIPYLRRYARGLTRELIRADDLVQDTLLRALSKQHLWEPGTNLRAWLFTILHHQRIDDLRRWVREGVTVSVDVCNQVPSVQPSAFYCLQLRDLQVALNALSTEQREVILLTGLEGMNYGAIAQVLGIPTGTVRSRLSRGRDRLRLMMDGGGEPRSEAARGHSDSLEQHPSAVSAVTAGRAAVTSELRS